MIAKLARSCITSRLFGPNWEITGKFFQGQRGSIQSLLSSSQSVQAWPGDRYNTAQPLPQKKKEKKHL